MKACKILLICLIASSVNFTIDDVAACVETQMEKPAQSQSSNLVIEPIYADQGSIQTTKNELTGPTEKLQYEADGHGPPFLEEADAEQERSNGAEYRKGSELFIAVEPGYFVKDEGIKETVVEFPIEEESNKLTSPCPIKN